MQKKASFMVILASLFTCFGFAEPCVDEKGCELESAKTAHQTQAEPEVQFDEKEPKLGCGCKKKKQPV